MLAQKNQQIKDLRAELKSKKEEDGEEDNDEKSEEDEWKSFKLSSSGCATNATKYTKL